MTDMTDMTDENEPPRRAPWWDRVVSHVEGLGSVSNDPADPPSAQDPWRDLTIDKVLLSAQQQDFLGDDQPAAARLGSIFALEPPAGDVRDEH